VKSEGFDIALLVKGEGVCRGKRVRRFFFRFATEKLSLAFYQR